MSERKDPVELSLDSLLETIRGRYAVRLMFAMLGAVVLMLVLGILVQSYTAGDIRNDVDRSLQTSAEVQAGELERLVSGLEHQAMLVSEKPPLGEEAVDADAVSAELTRMHDEGIVDDEVVAIAYVDSTESEVVASSEESFVGISPEESGMAFTDSLSGFGGPDEAHVSQPFSVDIVDHQVVGVVSPVPGHATRFVVLFVDFTDATAGFQQPVQGTNIKVVGNGGEVVAEPDGVWLSAHEESILESAFGGGGDDAASGVLRTDDGFVMAYSTLSNQNWAVMLQTRQTTAYGLVATVGQRLGGMILIALVSMWVLVATVGRSTSVTLRQLEQGAQEMGRGNLDVELGVDRNDELGTLATTLGEMRDSLKENIEVAESARAEADRQRQDAQEINRRLQSKAQEYRDELSVIASGDLTRRLDADSDNQAMQEVGEAINHTVESLEEAIAEVTSFSERVVASSQQVDAGATEVRRASEEASEAVQTIAHGATEQSELLSEVSSEVENLSATAEEVASSTDDLASTSDQAAEAGENGREAAETAIDEMNQVEARTEQVVEQIETLNDEMKMIGEITEFITDVAEQTNILALNANIEAARAGDAGEGFAVVAEEVKGLAEDTREAAEDIENRVDRVQNRTSETVGGIQETRERLATGVRTVEQAGEALETVADYVEDTDQRVRTINDATAKQARSVQSVSSTVEDVSAISEETTAEAEQVSAATEEQVSTLEQVSTNAGDLSSRASRLQALLGEFDVHDSTDPESNEVDQGGDEASDDGPGDDEASDDGPGGGGTDRDPDDGAAAAIESERGSGVE